MAKAMKGGNVKRIKISLIGVHGSLKKVAKKLAKSSDPKAKQLVADINAFNAKSKCPQVMVFKFNA